jgi:hypothetical protein
MKNLFTLVGIFFSGIIFSQGFQWLNSIGSVKSDFDIRIETDASGNVFAIGVFSDTMDIDPGPGITNLISNGSTDIFISKWTSNGALLWAKSFGNAPGEVIQDLALDALGNVYLIGYFFSPVDFDPGPASFTLDAEAGSGLYLLKLDGSGNFVYARSFRSAYYYIHSDQIAIDASQNVIIAGVFADTTDFDPGLNTNIIIPQDLDYYILKLNAQGNFVWVKTSTGSDWAYINDLTLDKAKNIIFTGSFLADRDFDPGANTNSLTSAGGDDAFVCKLDPDGNFIWVKKIGGASQERGLAVKTDYNMNIYYSGTYFGTSNPVDLDPGPGIATYSSSSLGGFISKLDANGDFAWADVFSESPFYIQSLAVDNGGVYFTGRFIWDEDFDPGIGTDWQSSQGSWDIFIMKLDFYGKQIWYRLIGSQTTEQGTSVCVDNQNNCYVAGTFSSTVDFDPDLGTASVTSKGAMDLFILKLKEYDVSVRENILADDLRIFPNPSSGVIRVKGNELYEKVELYDLLGTKIEEPIISYDTIDLSEIKNGTYFLKISSANESFTKKIIIEK